MGWTQGLLTEDATGRIVVDGTLPVTDWSNGLPRTASGALAISPEASGGTITDFLNGIPLVEDGKVAVVLPAAVGGTGGSPTVTMDEHWFKPELPVPSSPAQVFKFTAGLFIGAALGAAASALAFWR